MTIEQDFLTKSKFTKLVEQTVTELKISYMEAILHLCDKNDLEPEDMKKFVSPIIKDKLQAEAMQLNFLPKSNRDQIAKLIQAADQAGGGEKKSYADDRIWKPTVDKAGNGYAVLRFLPSGEGQELPWVRYWDHGFKGPTGLWYIENSLTSIGQPDPVGELNSRLWNSGHEEDKETARKQKRRLHYVVNALVVEDPSAPHNAGRVVLYKFGKKIFD